MIFRGRLGISLIILMSAMIAIGLWSYRLLLSSNTQFDEPAKVIHIRKNTLLESWLATVDASFIKDPSSFSTVATLKKFKSMKPGRYRIKKGMSNRELINLLRSGNQEPISLRIDDVHNIEELSAKLGKYLMTDSLSFMTAFTNDSMCVAFGFDTESIACLIAPNTYDFYWTMTPDEFLQKMKNKYDRYWTSEKKEQAASIGLTPTQVIILGSIVKAETAKKEEATKIAGLYLNRLRIGMALQSDPTAVFGRKTHSQRVYLNDLRTDTPCNTYLHTGLPPGPIDFVEDIYTDAVLDSDKNNYLYMCAQPGGSGYHNFSSTLDQHNVYRRAYTMWLEKNGIR